MGGDRLNGSEVEGWLTYSFGERQRTLVKENWQLGEDRGQPAGKETRIVLTYYFLSN